MGHRSRQTQGSVSQPEELGAVHSPGHSFLLLIVAGAGGPAADLTSELLNQLWVLLLHLLGKLLAPARQWRGSVVAPRHHSPT